MDETELKQRTKQFGIRIIKLVESLPNTTSGYILGKQLLRSGTSVGANYRSACRGKSLADFVTKISIALEEADESIYWMEMMVESNLVAANRLKDLMEEGDELVAILNASHKTARLNLSRKNNLQTESTNRKSKI